ncbi:hypothetical protein BDN72DRAFT_771644 [Pluteus cervinus]|uniref:Uncharacterized protein n=1 Tax=Pluteus cervinus TaxID=181527 RepID=A0ACD3AMT4_9AGAR|nr:hypothetical protein BDN72DRAFT_771644 [Pluteus cervinus]
MPQNLNYCPFFIFLHQPNVKVEKQEFDVDTVGARLFSIGFYPDPITLDKPTQNQAFDRDFIQSKYGGGHQDSVPTIGKKYYEKTGLKRFVYLNKMYQPLAPENAGDPGMYFDTPDFEGKVPCEETVVFTRFEANKWCYMGLYEMKAAPPLTKEEWGQQSKDVQDTWASKICRDPGENSKYNWGGLVRSRIHLRKTLGREPESAEVTDAAEKGLYKSITKEDVKKAYLNGTEKIIVWTLKCVGYDPALQQDLIKRSRTWSPPPPKGKRKAKGNDDNDKTGPTRKKRRVVKKQRVKVKSEMSSEAERSENYDNSDFMNVDNEEGVEPVYHPRVTRSRRKARALSPEV